MAAGSRPNLVRADTIDLQDQDAPSAAEHNKHLDADGIAPHQAAQFQHVQEERRSEEETLADAWNMAGQQTNGHDVAAQKDGEVEKKSEETDATGGDGEEDTDGEDDDDDMMDRMSSSPSIGDGAFSQPFLEPAAERSFGQPGTTQPAESDWATFNQSPSPTLDSSPFVDVPQHMPLQLEKFSGHSAQSTEEGSLLPSLPYWESFPFHISGSPRTSPEHHLLQGRYEPELFEMLDDEGFYNAGHDRKTQECDSRMPHDLSATQQFELRSANCKVPVNAFAQRHNENAATVDWSEEVAGVHEVTPFAADACLESLPSSTQSSASWESDTLDDFTNQTHEDDDANALQDSNDRYVDSDAETGSLQITEDIDFEFVYALHTFVATVEGQANATKGDTMVLLDDSNSYWWLVRVVKDSSIGMYCW